MHVCSAASRLSVLLYPACVKLTCLLPLLLLHVPSRAQHNQALNPHPQVAASAYYETATVMAQRQHRRQPMEHTAAEEAGPSNVPLQQLLGLLPENVTRLEAQRLLQEHNDAGVRPRGMPACRAAIGIPFHAARAHVQVVVALLLLDSTAVKLLLGMRVRAVHIP